MLKRPLCMVCVMLLLVGSLLIQLGKGKFLEELRPSQAEQKLRDRDTVTVIGTVEKTERKEKNQVIYLKDNSVKRRGLIIKEPKLIVYDSSFLKCHIGNTIILSGKAGFFQHTLNPGNFDQKGYYQRMNIHMRVNAEKIRVGDTKRNFLADKLDGIRQAVSECYTDALGEREGNVLSAMLLGEKGMLSGELKEEYQKNGIGHILAISGLHISFLGAGLYSLIRKAGGSFLTAGAAGVFFLVLYVIMIGIGVSAQRALIMFAVRIGEDITGRVYDMATGIGVAAAIIFLVQPLCIYDAGFILSFSAVVGIVTVCPAITGLFPRFKGKIGQAVLSSVGIQIMMFPLLLYYFYEIPLYSVFLNLIVIPSMSWILLAAVVGGTISFLFYPLALLLLKHLKFVLGLYEWLCKIAQSLPYARIVLGQPKIWQIITYYLALFIILHLCSMKKSDSAPFRKVACALLAALMTLICLPIYRPFKEAQIVMLDIGQGDSLFLRTPGGTTCLIDGGSTDVSEVGKYRIEPFLKSQAVGRLDYVFVSHGDADHMNGIQEMITRQELGVKIGCLVLPDQAVWDEKLTSLAREAKQAGIPVASMKKGQRIKEDSFDITCISPGAKDGLTPGNEASMVLSVTYKKFSMLFTGDTEGAGEKLLTEAIPTPYKILKAAHHGSENSSSDEFLQKANPSYTLISAGLNNRYGHPHKATLNRLKQIRSRILTTAEGGALSIKTNGDTMSISPFTKK